MTAAGRRRLVLEADGGSRGNPGVAGYGAVVRDAGTGRLLVELAQPLGLASNNVAEYSGLVAGLEAALEVAPGADVEVRMDSKLVVEQMSGRWKIKHEDMRRLALLARDVCSRISRAGGSVDFRWVPREQNGDADALSNEAMDGHTVRRVHAEPEPDAEPNPEPERGAEPAPEPEARRPLRLVLVQVGADPAAHERIGRAVARLVSGPSVRVAAGGPEAGPAASAVAGLTGGVVEGGDDWTAAREGPGPDERVRAAYGRLVAQGGDVVVVTSRRGVLTVVTEVLGVPAERFWVLATAPGSLTGVEVWGDGTATVAFTNRTDHLA